MSEIIKADLYRYCGETSILKGFKNPGFVYSYFFRKAKSTRKLSPLGLVYRFFVRKYKYKFGIQIPVQTKIGKGFYIGHFGSIVINKRAIIGENCNIAHSTTIGQTNRGKNKGYPVIGDKVWIGTGAVIVGKIKINNNVLIAPNTFVNMDVPPNSIVVGNPAKIIANERATDDYINHILKKT